MSEVKRFEALVDGVIRRNCVLASEYDALLAERNLLLAVVEAARAPCEPGDMGYLNAIDALDEWRHR